MSERILFWLFFDKMIKLKSTYIFCYILLSLFCLSFCLPPHQRRLSDREFNDIVVHENNNSSDSSSLDQLGLEYTRYLQQVIDALENDETFKKKLESAQEIDIRTAKIAEELEYVNHHVRSKLDELKRTELQRLRELAKQAYGSEHLHFSPPGHIDHENPNTFEISDLKKLIHKVAEDLEEADKKRKQMFKNYEMQKHFEREQKLQNMTEEERKKYLLEEEEIKKREQEAKKRVHHPGSKQQFEEVWEEQDHMNKNDFNPKTFFVMHDVDGNGFLDEEEVKTLFLKELDKLYSQGMPQADLMERAEEMERMREHVFNEVDKNRDRLISWEEFYAMSLRPEFNEDPGWQPLEDQQIYSPDELRVFEQQRLAEIEQLRKEGKIPYDPRTYPNQMNNQYNPGQNNPNIHYNPNTYNEPLHQQPMVQPQHSNLNQQHPNLNQQHPGLDQQYPGSDQQYRPGLNQQQPNIGQQYHPNLNQQQGDLNQPRPSLNQQYHPGLNERNIDVNQQQPIVARQPQIVLEKNQVYQNERQSKEKKLPNQPHNSNNPAAHIKISEQTIEQQNQ
ncbi:hypothetical protein PGB90_005886 [Kerria lacca]